MSTPPHSYFDSLPEEQRQALNAAAVDAAHISDLNMLKDCFTAGADPTPVLFDGIHAKNLDVVKLCIQSGADVNGTRKNPPTSGNGWEGEQPALVWSYLFFDKKISDCLLDAGANVDAQNANGNTPLMLAIFNLSPTKAEYYLSKGGDPMHLCNKSSPLQELQKQMKDMGYDARQQWQSIYASFIKRIAENAQTAQTISASFNMAVDHDTVADVPKLNLPQKRAAGGPKI